MSRLLPPLLLALTTACTVVPEPRTDAQGERGPRLLVVLRSIPTLQAPEVAIQLARSHGLEIEALWEMRSLRQFCVVYRAPGGAHLDTLAARLDRHPLVDVAQPERRFRLLSAEESDEEPADHYLHLQSGFHAIHAAEAQRWATGRGVRVAVVDTGIDFSHPDLAEAVTEAASFVLAGRAGFTEGWHGTAIAGVVAARARNGHGIRGVAPEASILAIRACEPAAGGAATCDSYALALALDHVVAERADVVNLSLAGPSDGVLALLLERALDRKIAVVAAAELEPGGRLSFPASLPGVLPVLAADTRARPPPATSASPPKDARIAPGFEILSTVPGGRYDFTSGSSLAAAHVTGIVALLLELDPELDPPAIAELLPASRLLDGCRAVARLRGDGDCPPAWSTPTALESLSDK
ncbi:MAG: S8 family peptidase [Thermoanaerobaculia bacterium]